MAGAFSLVVGSYAAAFTLVEGLGDVEVPPRLVLRTRLCGTESCGAVGVCPTFFLVFTSPYTCTIPLCSIESLSCPTMSFRFYMSLR
ncbi:hypothetical protein C8F01DRAFT_1157493 [Mycena amicta]|nr:hypothetical protein C8F01DRAFT_1157493 [Mycena amicta]